MLQLSNQPFPELVTERLLLRRITKNDLPEVFILRSDPQVMQFIDKEPAKTMQDAADFLARVDNDIDTNQAIQWAITLKENPSVLIGGICLWHFRFADYRAEIGYSLLADHWRKGIMREAAMKVMAFGFEALNLHSIEANINPNNIGSASLLESLGFVKEAHFKEDYFFRGKFLDTVIYSILQKNG